MGCIHSNIIKPSDNDQDKGTVTLHSLIEWKILPSQETARQKFINDGTLDPKEDKDPELINLRFL